MNSTPKNSGMYSRETISEYSEFQKNRKENMIKKHFKNL